LGFLANRCFIFVLVVRRRPKRLWNRSITFALMVNPSDEGQSLPDLSIRKMPEAIKGMLSTAYTTKCSIDPAET